MFAVITVSIAAYKVGIMRGRYFDIVERLFALKPDSPGFVYLFINLDNKYFQVPIIH